MFTWQGFLTAIVNYKGFKYSWQAELLASQSIIESGRGITDIAKNHGNFNGMKHRPELEKFGGKRFRYETDSEPWRDANGKEVPKGTPGAIQWDWFFEFETYEQAISTWVNWWNRSPYPKVIANDYEVMKNLQSFLEYVGPIYCPYFTESHSDSYASYIINKCLPEAKHELSKIVPTNNKTEIKIFNLINDIGLVVYTDKKPIKWIRAKDTQGITSLMLQYPSATSVIFASKDDIYPEAQKPIPQPVPTPVPAKTKIKGKGILLNNGHPRKGAGAVSDNGKVDEYELNLFQCNRIKAALDKVGIPCKIINQTQYNGDLYETGLQAEGYDAFIIGHHNKTKGAQYTVILLGDNPKAGSKEFGKILSSRISKVLGIPDNGTYGGYVVSVTKAGDSTNCPIVCLTESYFIDSFTDMETAYAWSAKAADEIANALIERFT